MPLPESSAHSMWLIYTRSNRISRKVSCFPDKRLPECHKALIAKGPPKHWLILPVRMNSFCSRERMPPTEVAGVDAPQSQRPHVSHVRAHGFCECRQLSLERCARTMPAVFTW